MDNKQFPEQEETPVIPEEQVPFPADTEPEAAAAEDIIPEEAEIPAIGFLLHKRDKKIYARKYLIDEAKVVRMASAVDDGVDDIE